MKIVINAIFKYKDIFEYINKDLSTHSVHCVVITY